MIRGILKNNSKHEIYFKISSRENKDTTGSCSFVRSKCVIYSEKNNKFTLWTEFNISVPSIQYSNKDRQSVLNKMIKENDTREKDNCILIHLLQVCSRK